jgi:hypothetical protein
MSAASTTAYRRRHPEISRLDENILRMTGCRDCLNRAADLVRNVPGPIFELGLGNGRSYDHLRRLFPDREIFVFERKIGAHPDCVPDDRHLLLGDIHETLPASAARFGGKVAMLHADIGGADPDLNDRLASFVGEHIPRLLRPEGVAVTSVACANLEPLERPASVDPKSYFMYRPRQRTRS